MAQVQLQLLKRRSQAEASAEQPYTPSSIHKVANVEHLDVDNNPNRPLPTEAAVNEDGKRSDNPEAWLEPEYPDTFKNRFGWAEPKIRNNNSNWYSDVYPFTSNDNYSSLLNVSLTV